MDALVPGDTSGVGANLTDKELEQNPHPILPTYQRHLILTYLCYFDI